MYLLSTNFRCLLALLRNEPTFDFALFGPEFGKYGETFMEGAVVRGLVTKIEREFFGLVTDRHVAVKAHVLEAEGALRKPEVLGHFFDEEGFSLGGRLVFGTEIVEQFVKFVHVFPGEYQELVAGEAMTEGVLAGFRFAFGCFGSGGVLGVFTVAFGVAGGGENGFRGRLRIAHGRQCGF